MKNTRNKEPCRDAKVYVNLALSNKSNHDYGTSQHGGRKGISNHYPLSMAAHASERPTDFLNDVKNMMFRQMEVEEGRCGSPSWIGKYNKELNHTGEQPLMVQRYLSNNKLEQQNGVLPVSQRPPSRFHVERDDDREYHQGLSLHQYLTATEMPGQSEKLVDVRHGRPTRTSLLRARQRTKAIPGLEKTKLEIRDDMHFLQEQALKREEKYKSVDVPEDLQPLRDDGETVHQFLVGARYNRAYYRDAKCFNKVGLYVSRENPQNCFLKQGTNQESLVAQKTEKANASPGGAYSEVSSSELNSLCQSTSSIHSIRQNSLRPPSKARQAWGNTTTSSIASAPSPTPNESRESFAYSAKNDPDSVLLNGASKMETDSKPKSMEGNGLLQTKRIQLKSAPLQQSTSSMSRSGVSCDSCVLCQEGSSVKKGMPVLHFHGRNIKSAPNRRKWMHNAQRGRSTEKEHSHVTPNKNQNGDLMLIQQYHLRILGTQMNMKKDETNESPRSMVHYTPGRLPTSRPKTAAPSRRRPSLKNRNNNNSKSDTASKTEDAAPGVRDGDAVSTTSRISVHISTPGDGTEEGEEGGGESPRGLGEITPRSQDVTVGSEQGGDASVLEQPTPRSLDLTVTQDAAIEDDVAVDSSQAEAGKTVHQDNQNMPNDIEGASPNVEEESGSGIQAEINQTDFEDQGNSDAHVHGTTSESERGGFHTSGMNEEGESDAQGMGDGTHDMIGERQVVDGTDELVDGLDKVNIDSSGDVVDQELGSDRKGDVNTERPGGNLGGEGKESEGVNGKDEPVEINNNMPEPDR